MANACKGSAHASFPAHAYLTPVTFQPLHLIVKLREVEEAVFGSRQDPEKTYGRRGNRAPRGVDDWPDGKSLEMIDGIATGIRHLPDDLTDPELVDDNPCDGADDSIDDGERVETSGVSLRIRLLQTKRDE